MGAYHRRSYPGGWNPSVDADNAPVDVLLRADNLIWDDDGVVSLRRGSLKLYDTALADLQVHSLFSTIFEGVKTRFAGSGNSIYKDGVLIYNGGASAASTIVKAVEIDEFDSSAHLDLGVNDLSRWALFGFTLTGAAPVDTAFGSHLGNVFMARSTLKKRHDGTDLLSWGLTAPTQAPKVTAADHLGTRLGSGQWLRSVGASSSATNGATGTVNDALDVVPDATSGRVTVYKDLYLPNGSTDLSSDGKYSGASDIFQLALKLDPNKVRTITLQFGLGPLTGSGLEYASDYYTYTWTVGDPLTPISLTSDELIAAIVATHGIDVDAESIKTTIQRVADAQKKASSQALTGVGVEVAEWFYFQIPRNRMFKVGTRNNLDWNVVKGVRIVVEGTAASDIIFDSNILLIRSFDSKVLAGVYKFRTVIVREGTDYYEKSAAGPVSAPVNFIGQYAQLSIPGSETINYPSGSEYKLYTYVYGGFLDRWYLAAKTDLGAIPAWIDEFNYLKVNFGLGAHDWSRFANFGFDPTAGYIGARGFVPGDDLSYNVITGDIDLYINNDFLYPLDIAPPDNIIGIAGPFLFRTFALTSDGTLWISRRLNPSSFNPNHAVQICGVDESPLWVEAAQGGLYVGTTRNIYRIEGTFDEGTDDSIDLTKRPLNPGQPPVDTAVAKDHNTLIYRSAAGWVIFQGETSTPLLGSVDLLYKGQVRHGVRPPNFVDTSARFRCAIARQQFVAIIPEGSDTFQTKVIHRCNLTTGKWYRHIYPNNLLSVYRDPDGMLIAGDDQGFLWQLDVGNDDGGEAIPVEVWTPNSDNGEPLSRKEPIDFQIKAETGLDDMSIAIHQDSSATATTTLTTSSDSDDWWKMSGLASVLSIFRRVQLRITGTFRAFKLYEWDLLYRSGPQHRMRVETGFLDFGVQRRVWIRAVQVKVRAAADLTVIFYGDGVELTRKMITVDPDVATVYHVPVGRNIAAVQHNIVVETTSDSGTGEIGFDPYYIYVQARKTGNQSQKEYVQVRFK